MRYFPDFWETRYPKTDKNTSILVGVSYITFGTENLESAFQPIFILHDQAAVIYGRIADMIKQLHKFSTFELY